MFQLGLKSTIVRGLKPQGRYLLNLPNMKSTSELACKRFYSQKPQYRSKTKGEPRIRYLFYMFVLSSLLVYFGTGKVEKKRVKTSFTEKELDEYEQATGIKRRSRLIAGDNVNKYKFYSIPYTKDEAIVEKLSSCMGETKVKVIDPQELLEKEKQDETRRYCYLLQDLEKRKKPIPHGLLTALVKEEVSFYINTSQGIYDTNFILKNYPQDTQEASKFETDIANLEKVVVLKNDIKCLPEGKTARDIDNVLSYFETVDKSEALDNVEDLKSIG